MNNLQVPKGKIDAVLDTDAYNEVDDQFAISYMLASTEKINTVAIYAAPFYNERSSGPEDGMLKSYDEIKKVLKLNNREDVIENTFMGSRSYLPNEKDGVISHAAEDLAKRAMNYSEDNPLYVVSIGAITNIASAILINPQIAKRIVVVWLGGHSREFHDTKEFNMIQDIASSRVVMQSEAPLVQLPCLGVVSNFTISAPEFEKWFIGKNPIADYLAKNTYESVKTYCKSEMWTRIIWDVTAVGWLMNDNQRFMNQRITDTYLPSYDGFYEDEPINKKMAYVYYIYRDNLMRDMIEKITK